MGLAVSSVMEGLVVSTMDSKFSFLNVARRMPINSVVGSYLDYLADKVLSGCVSSVMVHKDLLHPNLRTRFIMLSSSGNSICPYSR